jgi:hypothetical protein
MAAARSGVWESPLSLAVAPTNPAAGRPLWPSPSAGETHQRRLVAREPLQSPRRTLPPLLPGPEPPPAPGPVLPCLCPSASDRRRPRPTLLSLHPTEAHLPRGGTRFLSVSQSSSVLVVLRGLGLAWIVLGKEPYLAWWNQFSSVTVAACDHILISS